MTERDHVPPTFNGDAFHCPWSKCGSYAHMRWVQLRVPSPASPSGAQVVPIWRATCTRCGNASVWLAKDDLTEGVMLVPPVRAGVPPHPDMPEATRQLYDEARAVAKDSPRAAVALLRVAVDVLLRDVVTGAADQPLNTLIGLAVEQGLSPHVRVALDVPRAPGCHDDRSRAVPERSKLSGGSVVAPM